MRVMDLCQIFYLVVHAWELHSTTPSPKLSHKETFFDGPATENKELGTGDRFHHEVKIKM